MSGKEQETIVIVRKKGGHGGHHGGAWKVAYADFVTAMMAFFLVMWLVTQSKEVKQAVGGYFRDPGVFDFEKREGQDFVIDVALHASTAGAAATDDIADTIHYGELAEDVARPMIGYNVDNTCWDPHLKGVKLQVNSIYNAWRYEDYWFDR